MVVMYNDEIIVLFNDEGIEIASDDRAIQILRNLCNACLKDAKVERLSGKGDAFSVQIVSHGLLFALYTTPNIMLVLEKLCREFCKDKGAFGAELIASTNMMIGAVVLLDHAMRIQPSKISTYMKAQTLFACASIYAKAGISEVVADIVVNIKKSVRSIAENSEISSATIGDDAVGKRIRSSYGGDNKAGTDFHLIVAEAEYNVPILQEYLLDCMRDGVRHIVSKCIAPVVAAIGMPFNLSGVLRKKIEDFNVFSEMNKYLYQDLIVKIVVVEMYFRPERRDLHDSRYADLFDMVEREIFRVCRVGYECEVKIIRRIEQVGELMSEAQAELADKTQEHSHAMN